MRDMSESESAAASATALDRGEVAHVAKLALLNLSDDELDRFTGQLGAVLDSAADIAALDLGDLAPTHHPFGLTNVTRPDEVVTSLNRDEVLSQAPDVEDNRFRTPPALGEDS